MTNSIDRTLPDIDTYRLYFDSNNNGLLDTGIDFMISTSNGGEDCYVTLISQTSTSGCNFFDDIIGTAKFEESQNSDTDHVQFNISIPKRLFSQESMTNLTIRVRDSEIGWRSYPSDSPFFTSTYQINF